MSYGLHQTFNAKIPKRKLAKPLRIKLAEKFNNLDPEQNNAVFMLIVEHARLNEEFVYDPEIKLKLPYSIQYDAANKNVKVDIEKLPNKLQWILSRFGKIVNKK